MNEATGIAMIISCFVAVGALIVSLVQMKRAADVRVAFSGWSPDEMSRRISHLETENKQVWEKMERDKDVAKDRSAGLQAQLAGVEATLEILNQNISMLKLGVDRLNTKV